MNYNPWASKWIKTNSVDIFQRPSETSKTAVWINLCVLAHIISEIGWQKPLRPRVGLRMFTTNMRGLDILACMSVQMSLPSQIRTAASANSANISNNVQGCTSPLSHGRNKELRPISWGCLRVGDYGLEYY